jgi:ABC-type Zn uptake system ZnuABC Zn-binding protein ZnuA
VGRLALTRLLVAAAAVLAAAPSCGAAPLRVLATTADLAALSAAVGDDLVAVDTIVPAAADPEAFEPRPGDLDRVRHSELLVRVGLGYDHWLDRLVAQSGNAQVGRGGAGYVDASQGIPLLEVRGQSVMNDAGHSHGSANPHYWLDPQNTTIITAAIADGLVRLRPDERDRIIGNRQRVLGELDARLLAWTTQAAPFAGAKLIAYHNSWPYFARRFRLDIVDFIEPRPGVAPSPSHLAELISKGRAAKVRAILHEPYEPLDASRFLAQKLGVPLVMLATSVTGRPAATAYFELIEDDVSTLAKALGAQSQ